MASLPEGSMGTCTARISGAGCHGATSTTLCNAWLPFIRSRNARSTSTRRRCLSSLYIPQQTLLSARLPR